MLDIGCLVVIGLAGVLIAIFSPIFRVFLFAALGFVTLLTICISVWEFSWRTSRHPWHGFRAKMGWGKRLDVLATRLGSTEQNLYDFAPTYRKHMIPKRSGGMRELHIPDPSTMELQKAVLRRVLHGLRSHSASKGFEKGCSIVDNAKPHVGQTVLIKLDVINFFSNTSEERVRKYFQRIGWGREAAQVLTRIVTHDGGLPQGAPTSPRLSNLVNYNLDVRLQKIAARRKGRYTRYADDITMSFPLDYSKKMRGAIQLARKQLKVLGYTLNQRKVRILRPHQRQSVTGLNVNTKVSLPRKLRRQLRAARHRVSLGKEATWTAEQLAGYAALEHMVQTQSESDQN